ncbi:MULTISPECIES: Cof-type HAD-IIB family hydrolase [Fusobacterium]|uniref:Cof-type HAD-IIB family hydrolase n=1 Tax=Fusobacterium TaxID=848 RepID=UPI0014772C88|nr:MULTISPECIES: Cof-type HAD-IIB family hydrolase [Fusobacterium]NME36616.1 HAD family phosphatase [Fusobacterium sp. FSA-380-WT-3A]
MIKAIALDLDGTLLNDKKEVTDRSVNILRKLYKKGIEILIVTGRPYASTTKIIDRLGIPMTAICYNGGKIIDTVSGEILENKLLPENIAIKLFEYIEEKKLNLNIFMDEKWYANDLDSESVQIYKKNSGLIPTKMDIKTFPKNNITKGVLIGKTEILENYKKELESLIGKDSYITFTQPLYLEILNKDINKGKALKRILELKNIDINQCIAFGDAENDKEMLQVVGINVAMKDSIEELKEICTYVTKNSNNDDGVAKFLEEYFNEK